MSDNNHGSAIIGLCTAFAAGAIMGAGLALLYAPHSGKETRDLVGKKVREIKDAAGNVIAQVKHKAGDMIDKGHETIG